MVQSAKRRIGKAKKAHVDQAGSPESANDVESVVDVSGTDEESDVDETEQNEAEEEPSQPIDSGTYQVELVEGATYAVKGMTFYKSRPVVVADKKVLSRVLINSRFKCRMTGGK